MKLIKRVLRRKASLTKLVSFSVLFVFLAYEPISVYQSFNSAVDIVEAERDRNMAITMENAKLLHKNGLSELLTTTIRNSIIANDIAYFVVYKKGVQIHAEPADEILAVGNTFAERKAVLGKHLSDKNRSELTAEIGSDTVLTLGRPQKLRQSMLEVIFKTDLWKKILLNYLVVSAIAMAAFILHTRDLTAVVTTLRDKGRI